MFKGTGLTALYIYQDPKTLLNNKIGKSDEADIQKSYARSHGKDDETVTIASRSRHIGRKLQTQTNTASPPGINIAPSEYPSITSRLTHESSEDDGSPLLGGASLYLDPAGDDISILDDNASLPGGGVYPSGYDSLGVSTATGHASASKVKKSTSILTQYFNATLNK